MTDDVVRVSVQDTTVVVRRINVDSPSVVRSSDDQTRVVPVTGGSQGAPGESPYDLAVENGFVGSVDDWLASLVGAPGADGVDPYQMAVDNGFVGTQAEWLASLQGVDGKSPYDLAVENGFVGTQAEWLASLQGVDGKSAYQVWLDAGHTGTVADYIASLKGADSTVPGPPGVGVQSVVRTSGNGAPGTTDTYTITLTNGSTSTFTVANGANGQQGPAGAGVVLIEHGGTVPAGTPVGSVIYEKG